MTTRNVCIALALISAAACGGGGGGSSSTGTPPPGNTNPPTGGVSVTNNAFTPATQTVPAGGSVVWAWNTCTGDPYGGNQLCVRHGVNFADGTNSPTQDHGTYSRTFTAPGTYNYLCAVHGAEMAGSIIVQ